MPTQATCKPWRRAASANRIGKRPLPASRPISGSAAAAGGRDMARRRWRVVGEDTGLSESGPALLIRAEGVVARRGGGHEQRDLRRELAELAVHLGQPGDHLEDAPLLADGDGRRAE